MGRVGAKMSYANVVATLALFLALGGVSYAAITIPKGSVGARQLRTGAVTSAKVRDHSLRSRDFAPGVLPLGGAAGPQGAPGERGAAGATGPQGVQGERGGDGATGPQGVQGDGGAAGATGPQGVQGERGERGPEGRDPSPDLLDPANDLPAGEGAYILLNDVSIASVTAYRIDCAEQACTLSVGVPTDPSAELDAWLDAALAGEPTATRTVTLVLRDYTGRILRQFKIEGARPVASRALNEREEVTFSTEAIVPLGAS
jgi:hypothetical protein